MLVVDPLKRITIHEIRQNPWFNVGLPEYLRPLPDTAETLTQEIDESILSELSKVSQSSSYMFADAPVLTLLGLRKWATVVRQSTRRYPNQTIIKSRLHTSW